MSHDKINLTLQELRLNSGRNFVTHPALPERYLGFIPRWRWGGTGTQVRLRHVKDLLENACVSLPPFSCENIPVRSGFLRLNQY